MEFLERTEFGFREERWMVRIDGAIATARVFTDEDLDYNVQIANDTRTWATFHHPRVVPLISISPPVPRFVITSGDERGLPITHAAKHLAAAGIDREAWAVAEMIAIADAITAMAAHDAGFVHRRANTEQIVVGADGLARLRAPIAHVTVDTVPGYLGRGPGIITAFRWMSPEQGRGKRLTPASDVFQLATTLYTLLTGAHAAPGNSDFEQLTVIVNGPPPAPPRAHTPGLADIVLRGLERDPDERYPDPAAFATALRSLPPGDPSAAILALSGRQVHAPPSRSAPIASARCHKEWDRLESTSTDGVRHCDACGHDVVRVSSALALVPLLGKRCVAFHSDDN